MSRLLMTETPRFRAALSFPETIADAFVTGGLPPWRPQGGDNAGRPTSSF